MPTAAVCETPLDFRVVRSLRLAASRARRSSTCAQGVLGRARPLQRPSKDAARCASRSHASPPHVVGGSCAKSATLTAGARRGARLAAAHFRPRVRRSPEQKRARASSSSSIMEKLRRARAREGSSVRVEGFSLPETPRRKRLAKSTMKAYAEGWSVAIHRRLGAAERSWFGNSRVR